MDLSQIILKPIVTEKSLKGHPFGQYSFKVHQDANKTSVAKAANALFGVDTIKVTISNVKSSLKVNSKRKTITVAGYKKAVVFVKKGQTISIFEEPKEEKKAKKAAKTKETKE